MKNLKLTIQQLLILLVVFSCSSEENIPYVAERIAQIVADSQSPAEGGTPSLEDLTNAGVQNATGDQANYEAAIASASPAPTTLTELQDIVNKVNGGQAYLGNTQLVWFDEFETPGSPSDANWTYNIGTNNGWGNGESQYYTSREDNVVIEDGILKIKAKRETFEGANYTSARIKTQAKYSFTYGKVEVRAKLPSSAGTWPAIWMLGANISSVGWPNCGEIDIMEQKGWDKSKISAALHNQSSSGNTVNYREIEAPTSTTSFHVYSVNWTPDEISFAIDGNVYYTYSPEIQTEANWPYDSPQFIILNVAMGGSLGGEIPDNFSESMMEIDYVRVYR